MKAAGTPASPFATQGVSSENVYDYFKGREPTLYGRNNRFEGMSTTADTYRQWEMPPPPAPRAHPPPAASAPFDGTTSYKKDYPAHPLEPHAVMPQQVRAVKQMPFEGSTTYADVFKAYEIEPRSHPAAAPPPVQSVPFDGCSQYKDTFRAHPLPERPPPPAVQARQQVPFDGSSSYRDMFPAYEIPAPPAPRAPPTPSPSPPFVGTTTTGSTYVAHKIEPHAPLTAKPFTRPNTKFEGTTTARDTYRQWELPERAALQAPAIKPSLPFEGTTTHREAFKGFKLPKRRRPLGVAMLGDQYMVLIPSDVRLPHRTSQVFTTSHDNQDTICILVLEGEALRASSNRPLGQFDLTGMPMGPRGAAKVEVTFALDADNILKVEAKDLNDGRHAEWLSNGGAMVAHVDSSRMDTQGYVRAATPERN